MLNNDCSRFRSLREQTPFSAPCKILYVLVNYNKPQPHLHSEDTSIQGTFALITRVSPEQTFYRERYANSDDYFRFFEIFKMLRFETCDHTLRAV